MNEHASACKLCGGASDLFLTRNCFDIARCNACGFMFALLPHDFDPLKLYNDSYFTRENGYGFNDYDALWTRCCGRFYVPRLTRLLDFHSRGRLLDIGCAGGQLMSVARERGWEVSGIEPAPAMRRQVSERLHSTVYESIQAAVDSGRRFDCISMFEVIEHLLDPLSTLQQVAGLLEPGGVIALSTPNCGSPAATLGKGINIWFCPPLHISYFTPATLSGCLGQVGLKMLALDGLEHYCRAMAGEVVLPAWLAALLRPVRRGKRLRPHGGLGRLLKRIYEHRLSLYQRRHPADLSRTDVLEIYARRAA